MAWLQKACWVALLAILGVSCTQLDGDLTSTCQPECGPTLRCMEGQCQPIVCMDESQCVLGQICHEGRCAISCDGETHCPGGECDGTLCIGSMECVNGEIRPCETACGEGVERCSNFAWSICSAGVPTAEDACGDGVDGDCDGEVDEGCPACTEGGRRPCENDCGTGEQACEEGRWTGCSIPPPDATGECPCVGDVSEACDTPCGRGLRTCENGEFGACLFEGSPCLCAPGSTEMCDTQCGSGRRVCRDGEWSACDGPEPLPEVCGNGLDEDCDGDSDEECSECRVEFVDQPSIVTQLDSLYQDIQLVALNSSVWMGYYRERMGSRISAYVSYRVRQNDFRIASAFDSDMVTLRHLSVNGGSVLGVGADRRRDVGVELLNSQGVRRQETVPIEGSALHYFVLGNTPTLHVLYRLSNDGLYLQSLPQDASRPSRLRLGNASRFRISPSLDSQGMSVFYESEEGNFAEGRVLSMMRIALTPNRLLADERLVDPRDNGPLFGDDPVVHFANDHYLLVYGRRVNGQASLFSAYVDLNGQIVSGPTEIYRARPGYTIGRSQLAAKDNRRILVWSEYERFEQGTDIKHVALDPMGHLTSDVVSIFSGQVALPNIAWPAAGRPVLVWTQEDISNMTEFFTLKIATVPADPTCR